MFYPGIFILTYCTTSENSYERYTFLHDFCRKCERGRVKMCTVRNWFLTIVSDFLNSVTPCEVFSNFMPYSQPTASLRDRLCTCSLRARLQSVWFASRCDVILIGSVESTGHERAHIAAIIWSHIICNPHTLGNLIVFPTGYQKQTKKTSA